MLSRVGFWAVAAAVLCSTPALASDRGSMQDQLACTPDVYRLCSQFIPDEDAIVGCLKRNLPSLSAGCHRVFSEPNPGATTEPPKKEDDDD